MLLGGLVTRVRRHLPRPASPVEGLALAVALAATLLSLYGLLWTGKHYLAIYRLTRGVGDTVFYGADGQPWFPLDEHRRDVRLDQISPYLRDAVIAAEDHRFYRHPGIDPIAVGRATLHNLKRGRLSEGGSTLTQQLARTLFLSNRRTLGRKAKEAILARMLEQVLDKNQILELYLNRVSLSGGLFGVEAMSRSLFEKRALDLNLAESVLVAGLIRSPSALSPWSNLDGAVGRSRVVLARIGPAASDKAQHGSAFKPFVYAAALERGFSPVSVLTDLRGVGAEGRAEWAPSNAEGEGPDALTLRQGLLESNNQAAVALQQRIGSGAVLRVA